MLVVRVPAEPSRHRVAVWRELRRLGAVPIQHLLLALGLCMVGWHSGNLVVTLRSLFGVEHAQWNVPLRLANTTAVVSITFSYSLLLHVHIHLWASSHGRDLTRIERIRREPANALL